MPGTNTWIVELTVTTIPRGQTPGAAIGTLLAVVNECRRPASKIVRNPESVLVV